MNASFTDEALGNCEESNGLCAALEAMFVHGTKKSFLGRLNKDFIVGGSVASGRTGKGGGRDAKRGVGLFFILMFGNE